MPEAQPRPSTEHRGEGGAGDGAAVREAVASRALWYHTIELPSGVTTPGWFDLRPIVDRLPWPDVRGKRCLDVGTYDGYLAFELERRGASEVVATDIADHALWDWPPSLRGAGTETLAARTGEDKTGGFAIAREALGSKVEHKLISVYDLSPESVGTFEVVVCGALMLHLRDPLGALQAIRSVCDGAFLSSEAVNLRLTAQHPRTPMASLDGVSTRLHWWLPNTAGHRQMVRSSGFEIERSTRPFSIRFGDGFPRDRLERRPWKRRGLRRALAGADGVPHAAVLARAG